MMFFALSSCSTLNLCQLLVVFIWLLLFSFLFYFSVYCKCTKSKRGLQCLGKVETKKKFPMCNNIFVSNIAKNIASKDHKLFLQSVVEYES